MGVNYLDDTLYASATEGLFDPNKFSEIKRSTPSKTADSLMKQAKKLYGMGSKEKAKNYMSQAKSLYEQCLAKAKSMAGMKKAERTEKIAFGTPASMSSQKAKYQGEVATKYGAAPVIGYFESRIDACDAYLLQWENKAGNQDYKDTLARLKNERKEEKKRMRNGYTATEAFEQSLIALDSMMEELEFELAMDIAVEADTGDEDLSAAGDAPKKANILKRAIAKVKNAFKRGDKAGAEAAMNEAEEALDDLGDIAEETDESDTKGCSKVKKALLIAGVAVGALAAFIGLRTAVPMFTKWLKGKKEGGEATASENKGIFAKIKDFFAECWKNLKGLPTDAKTLGGKIKSKFAGGSKDSGEKAAEAYALEAVAEAMGCDEELLDHIRSFNPHASEFAALEAELDDLLLELELAD